MLSSAITMAAPPRVIPARPAALQSLQSLALSWHEARPVVQVMFALRFGIALALSVATVAGTGVVLRPLTLVCGAASWICTVWVVYLLNGVSDINTDRRNGSDRPLASGLLDLHTAIRCCVLISATGLVLAAVVSTLLVMLVVGMLVLGWLYSMGARAQKANLAGFFIVVTLGGVFTYLAGWATVQAAIGDATVVPPLSLVVFAVVMSLWMALAGTSKDIADVDGDREAGRRTLPVLLGDRGARMATGLVSIALAAGFQLVAARVAPQLVPVAAVLVAGALAMTACALSWVGRGDRGRSRRPYRTFMFTQYIAHLALLWTTLI